MTTAIADTVLSLVITTLFSLWVWSLKRDVERLQAAGAMMAPMAHAVHAGAAGGIIVVSRPHDEPSTRRAPADRPPPRTREGGIATWTIDE